MKSQAPFIIKSIRQPHKRNVQLRLKKEAEAEQLFPHQQTTWILPLESGHYDEQGVRLKLVEVGIDLDQELGTRAVGGNRLEFAKKHGTDRNSEPYFAEETQNRAGYREEEVLLKYGLDYKNDQHRVSYIHHITKGSFSLGMDSGLLVYKWAGLLPLHLEKIEQTPPPNGLHLFLTDPRRLLVAVFDPFTSKAEQRTLTL